MGPKDVDEKAHICRISREMVVELGSKIKTLAFELLTSSEDEVVNVMVNDPVDLMQW